MNKFITLILCLCCALTVAQATGEDRLNDSDANVFGHVLDKKTGEHLPFINVLLKGTTIGTTTDNSGHYFLKNLPEGKFTLEYKALGYKTISKEVTLKKGKTLEINVELEEDQIALDGVVVSANRAETSRRLAPTLVNVLDAKVFTTTNAVNLAQGLNFQPGVRVETNCQNCGFQQVRINGLDGPYTQILIDSRPIFSALSGVYGLEQIPANMIERVEVMRGGGSALFGSSAIAGTINIITKKTAVGGSATVLTGEEGRAEYRLNYGFNAGKLNAFLSGAKSSSDGYLLNNDFDNKQYNIKLGYKFSDADALRLGYSKNKLERGYILRNLKGYPYYDPSYPETIGDGLIQPGIGDRPANGITGPGNYGRGSYWSKDTDHYDLNYTHTFSNGFLQFDYYRNNEERREVLKDHSGTVKLDRVIPSDKTDYFAISGQSAVSSKHTLGYGAQYQRMRYGYGHYNVKPTDAGDLYPSQKIDNAAVYLEDNWQLDGRWRTYLGLRYDHYKAGRDDARAGDMQGFSENSLSPKFSLQLTSDDKNTSSLSVNRV